MTGQNYLNVQVRGESAGNLFLMKSVKTVRYVKSAVLREGLPGRIDGRTGRRKAALAA